MDCLCFVDFGLKLSMKSSMVDTRKSDIVEQPAASITRHVATRPAQGTSNR